MSFADGQKEALAKMLLQFLERPDAAGRIMTAIGGFIFEDFLKEKADELSLSVEDVSAKKLPFDLVINGHRVQAKSSASMSGVVDVRPVRPIVGTTTRRYSLNCFDVLAVHLAAFDEVFIIPVHMFQCGSFDGMVKGSFVREKEAAWRNRWDVLSCSPGDTPTQSLLF